MASDPSFGNGTVLKNFNFINESLGSIGIFTTNFVDVSEFSNFNLVVLNSNANLQIDIIFSLNGTASTGLFLSETINTVANTALLDLGVFLVKARYLRLVLTGIIGHNFALQLGFRRAVSSIGLLENVGGFVESYVTGTIGDFRTLQSSDSSLTITQNVDNIDIISAVSVPSLTNVGGFVEVFVDPSTGDFRTFQSSDASLTITQNVNDIDIVSAVSVPVLTNVGGFVEVFVDASGGNLRTIQSSDSSLTITQNANDIDIISAISIPVLTNVGGFVEVFVDASGGNLRTIQSSDSSLTITQNANDIDIVSAGSSLWQESSAILSPVTASTSLIGGGNLNTISSNTHSSIISGVSNQIGSDTLNCGIFNSNTSTILGTGSKENSGIFSGFQNNILGTVDTFSCSIFGGNGNDFTSTSSTATDYLRYCSIIGGLDNYIQSSASGFGGCDSCSIISSETSFIEACNSCSILTSLSSSIVGGSSAAKVGCSILGCNTSTITGDFPIISSTLIGGFSNDLLSSGNVFENSCILAGESNNITSADGTIESSVIIGSQTSNIEVGIGCGIYSSETCNISTAPATNCIIIGSADSSISGAATFPNSNSCIIGGTSNLITSSPAAGGGTDGTNNIIIGGTNNTIYSAGAGGRGNDCCIIGSGNTCGNGSSGVDNAIIIGTNSNSNNLANTILICTDSGASSSTTNQITMKASNGSRIFSNSGNTTGVSLAAGGGSWSSICDENVKENIIELDYEDIQNRFAGLSIKRYNYIGNDPGMWSYGPTAQEFHTAFPYPQIERIDENTGQPYISSAKDPLQIESGDLIGIACGCIKQLTIENNSLKSRVALLEQQIISINATLGGLL